MQTVNEIRLVALSKRHELGLSQDQVAALAGVSRKWLSEFERGKATAELGLVLRLLNGLGLEIAVTEKRSSTSPAVDLDELLSEYRR